ncbi:MAG: STAS domain-containing protein [Phycisphaerae bacterium]|nr:STAS domain-containing protein [Phycisphaerae bacterium]
MNNHEPKLRVTQGETATQVDLLDLTLTDEQAVQNLRDSLYGLVDGEPNLRLVINLEAVDFLSTAAIGVLVAVRRRADRNQAHLRLSAVAPAIQQTLDVTRLAERFEIHDTAEHAMRSF